MVRALNIALAVLLSFMLSVPAYADRTMFAAYQLIAGATALGNLVFSGTSSGIARNDNTQYLGLSGGTALNSSTAGANLLLYGASAGSGGTAYLFSGNQATANVLIETTNGTSHIRFRNPSGTIWYFDSSGRLVQDGTNGGSILINKTQTGLVGPSAGVLALNLGASSGTFNIKTSVGGDMWTYDGTGGITQDATNGGNIVFSKTNTGVRGTVATGISAAGSASGDATVISSEYNNVSTASAGQGVRLQSFPVGMTVFIRNQSANAFNLYPPTGGNILGYGTDAAASLAVNATAICKIQTALFINCAEAPNI